MILLVNSGGEAAVPEWQAEFRAVASQLDVRWWQDPAVDLADVPYVFVWSPTPGWLARLTGLRLILSSGAGVDHITADPDWPRHVGIVRMGGAETAQRMGEWVCLAALALLRDLPAAIAGQAARRWVEMPSGRTAPETRVGVMGLGNLGAAAAVMLRGLGFRVSGWSRTPKRLPGVECFAGAGERDAFLAGADILVCLLPDTAETRGAVRAETIALLPPGAGVVNAGRACGAGGLAGGAGCWAVVWGGAGCVRGGAFAGGCGGLGASSGDYYAACCFDGVSAGAGGVCSGGDWGV